MTTLAGNTTITPEDLLRMEDAVSYELVDGQLVERNVSRESSRVGLTVGRLLANHEEQSGEAEVYGTDLGYQCFPDEPARIRKPDASVVRRERLTNIPADVGYMPIPPDLAVEVVSPNDLAYDVAEKVEEYLKAGYGQVWVVHPNTRTVTVHRNNGTVAHYHENDEISAEPALLGFRCRVGEFFRS
jgi:Uma2 family endonuclease